MIMKKIPTLFEREFDDKHNFTLLNKVREGFEWVLKGEGIPTVKVDGQCTAIINGVFYKRYDNKKGKKLPDGAIKCCEPDAITGHSPYWIPVSDSDEDKWLRKAYDNTNRSFILEDGTYEAIGLHFQGNPYELNDDYLLKHGSFIIEDYNK